MELKRKQVLIKKKPLQSIAENKMIVEEGTEVKVVFPFLHQHRDMTQQHEDTFSNAIWPSKRNDIILFFLFFPFLHFNVPCSSGHSSMLWYDASHRYSKYGENGKNGFSVEKL